jgi:plasmid stabilization system protein ParE
MRFRWTEEAANDLEQIADYLCLTGRWPTQRAEAIPKNKAGVGRAAKHGQFPLGNLLTA